MDNLKTSENLCIACGGGSCGILTCVTWGKSTPSSTEEEIFDGLDTLKRTWLENFLEFVVPALGGVRYYPAKLALEGFIPSDALDARGKKKIRNIFDQTVFDGRVNLRIFAECFRDLFDSDLDLYATEDSLYVR